MHTYAVSSDGKFRNGLDTFENRAQIFQEFFLPIELNVYHKKNVFGLFVICKLFANPLTMP